MNDLWRWKIFRNEVPKDEWNSLFWELKNEYVGVEAPVVRTEEDLDPPTIFHISGGYTMMRYFTKTFYLRFSKFYFIDFYSIQNIFNIQINLTLQILHSNYLPISIPRGLV